LEEELKEELAGVDDEDDVAEVKQKYEREWEEINPKPFSSEEV